MPRALNIAGKRLMLERDTRFAPFLCSFAFECVRTYMYPDMRTVAYATVCVCVDMLSLHRLPCFHTLPLLLLLTLWYHSLVSNVSSFRLSTPVSNHICRRLPLNSDTCRQRKVKCEYHWILSDPLRAAYPPLAFQNILSPWLYTPLE